MKTFKMRGVLATMLLVMVIGGGSSPADAQEASEIEWCSFIGEIAVSIVSARQAGVPPTDVLAGLLQVAGEVEDAALRDALEEMYRALVLDVYALPMYSSDEYRQRQRQEFRQEVEAWCLSL